MEPEQAAKLVAMLAATYPTPGWEKATLTLYREQLLDLDADVTARVVDAWIKSRDERPTVAQIRRGVAKAQAGASGFLPPDEAWGYVVACFGTVGRYREFPAEYPLVKAAVERLGWAEMCSCETVDVLRGQFRMAYTALLERSLEETAVSAGAAQLPAAMLEHGRPALEDGTPYERREARA